jgi:uncharacterized protein
VEFTVQRAAVRLAGGFSCMKVPEMTEPLDPELLNILVCPESHARLVQVGDWLYSTDPATRRRYPIREGIPIMLLEESEVVDEQQHGKVLQEAGVNRS